MYHRIVRITSYFALLVLVSVVTAAGDGRFPITRLQERGNRKPSDPGLSSNDENLDLAENTTASPAPSIPPSVSPMPTTTGGHNTTTISPAPSNPPSISPPPTRVGGVPSAPPSISFPPTTTNHSHPPSVSPMPSSPPTPDTQKGGTSILKKLLRAVGWTALAITTALAFGWIVSNHRRILPLLGELWFRIRTTDWRRFVMNLAASTREVCSGLYHRLRFGRWSFRGLGGRDYDTVPLNEIVFDPHDSGDPTELLLQRER